MNKYQYAELHGKIVARYGTLREYAEALGISTNSLAYKLNGKSPWKYREIVAARELLALTEEEINKYFFTQKLAKT